MSHVELRTLDDDDLDAIFEMMRDRDAIALLAFTADDPDGREAFDRWIAAERARPDVSFLVITDRGGFAGTIAAFTVGTDREVSFWLPRHAWGRGVATEALRVLVSREAERPLFARVAAHNAAAITVFQRNGFTEVSRNTVYAPGLGREVDEVVFALLPALDGV